jgi:hypothetical protein
MLIDGRRVPTGERLKADICVVGAGAAGITICKELLSSGLDIILLEAGGAKREKFNQRAKASLPISMLHHQCTDNGVSEVRQPSGEDVAFLDKGDFAFRGWVSGGGWPFGRIDLDPYYERAMPYFEAGNFSFDEHQALDKWEPRVDGFRSDQWKQVPLNGSVRQPILTKSTAQI